jgi:hypothetical protein
MPGIVKDSKFWWGVGAGFFVAPFVVKFARMQLTRIKAAGSGNTAG